MPRSLSPILQNKEQSIFESNTISISHASYPYGAIVGRPIVLIGLLSVHLLVQDKPTLLIDNAEHAAINLWFEDRDFSIVNSFATDYRTAHSHEFSPAPLPVSFARFSCTGCQLICARRDHSKQQKAAKPVCRLSQDLYIYIYTYYERSIDLTSSPSCRLRPPHPPFPPLTSVPLQTKIRVVRRAKAPSSITRRA